MGRELILKPQENTRTKGEQGWKQTRNFGSCSFQACREKGFEQQEDGYKFAKSVGAGI